MHSIELTEATYRHLSERRRGSSSTSAQLIEQLLAAPSSDIDLVGAPPAGAEVALAAVSRLSGLFADVTLPDIDAALVDPMIALANTGLDELGR